MLGSLITRIGRSRVMILVAALCLLGLLALERSSGSLTSLVSDDCALEGRGGAVGFVATGCTEVASDAAEDRSGA